MTQLRKYQGAVKVGRQMRQASTEGGFEEIVGINNKSKEVGNCIDGGYEELRDYTDGRSKKIGASY